MLLYEKEIVVHPLENHSELLEYVSEAVLEQLPAGEMPVRFVITRTDDKGYYCELGVISDMDNLETPSRDAIFDFNKRSFQNTDQFIFCDGS